MTAEVSMTKSLILFELIIMRLKDWKKWKTAYHSFFNALNPLMVKNIPIGWVLLVCADIMRVFGHFHVWSKSSDLCQNNRVTSGFARV